MAQYRFNFGAEKTFIDNVSSNAIELINSEGTIKIDNLTITGNLTVDGTTTTINSTTLQVDDKNIELGTVATPSDTTADGGGITLKGATDKTILWTNSTDAWHFNQGINVTSGNVGIGTTAPDRKLDIVAGDNTTPQIKLRAVGTNTQAEIHADANTGYFRILTGDGNGSQTPKLVIGRTNGNVGIGTASPTQGILVLEASSGNVILRI